MPSAKLTGVPTLGQCLSEGNADQTDQTTSKMHSNNARSRAIELKPELRRKLAQVLEHALSTAETLRNEVMRSELVFAARHTLRNRYVLCQAAAKACRYQKLDSRRID
jgi:hypothetical protein